MQPHVGLFGLLGSGNLGNDGSLQVMMDYLDREHPEAIIDCFCAGPETVQARYGIAATPLGWYQRFETKVSGASAVLLKVTGKFLDIFRTAGWVRAHDVVIVPGMGSLEETLPLNPWGFPYALFLVSALGLLFATKVALVDVGASVISRRSIRHLFASAAGLAHYRSFRDELSKDAVESDGGRYIQG